MLSPSYRSSHRGRSNSIGELPEGPAKDLSLALLGLIEAAHSDGKRTGSFSAYVRYRNACAPGRRHTSGEVTDQLGQPRNRQGGADWDFVLDVVQFCVPAEQHELRRRALGLRGGNPTTQEHVCSPTRHHQQEIDERAKDVLPQLAGLWCAAQQERASQPGARRAVAGVNDRPPGYIGEIVTVDDIRLPPCNEDDDVVGNPLATLKLLRGKVCRLKRELAGAEAGLMHARAEHARLADQLRHAHTTSRELRSRCTNAEAEVQRQADALTRLRTHLVEADQQCRLLEIASKSAEQQLRQSHESLVDQLQRGRLTDAEEYETVLDQLEHARLAADGDYESLVESLEDVVEKMERAHLAAEEDYEGLVEKLEDRLENAQRAREIDRDQHERRIEALTADVAAKAHRQVSVLRAQLETSRRDVERQNSEAADLRSRLDYTQDSLKTAQHTASTLRSRLASVCDENAYLVDKLSESRDNQNWLTRRVSDLENAARAEEGELQAAYRNVSQVEADRQIILQERSQMCDHVATLQAWVDKLNAEHDDWVSERRGRDEERSALVQLLQIAQAREARLEQVLSDRVERDGSGGSFMDRVLGRQIGHDPLPPQEEWHGREDLLLSTMDDVVYLTGSHPRYHLRDCSSLQRAASIVDMSVKDAIERGNTACGWCTPNRTLTQRQQPLRSARRRQADTSVTGAGSTSAGLPRRPHGRIG